MKKKLVAIIQARMGSSRLPGKVLMTLMDKPVLWHIHNRLSLVEQIDEVCIATSYLRRDDPIEDFCSDHHINCFRGNDADVLDRYYKAAVEYNAGYVLRIAGDCPLVDSQLIKQMVDYFITNHLHYCDVVTVSGVTSDEYCRKYTAGLDAEIFSFYALEKAWKEADGILYREHVTPYLWKHPEKFKIGTYMSYGRGYTDHRWTMDNEDDYEIMQGIYNTLYPKKPGFNMDDVFELMKRQPHIFRKNKGEYLNQM